MTNYTDTYLSALSSADTPAEPDWLKAKRTAARAQFSEAGFPHRRVEAWRYSDLSRILKESFSGPAREQADLAGLAPASTPFDELTPLRVVFIDGMFSPEASQVDNLPEGLTILPLSDALLSEDWLPAALAAKPIADDQSVQSLNLALAQDGIVIKLEAGRTLATPVLLHHHTTGTDVTAHHNRHVVFVEDGASLTLAEVYTGTGNARKFADHVTDLHLGEGAHLHQLTVQDEAHQTVLLGTQNSVLAKDAQLERFTLLMGAEFSRLQNFVDFAGTGAHAGIYTAYALRGDQHADATTMMSHAVPHTTSMTHAKGVLDDRSTGVFQGKVLVARDAQKVDGEQMSNALLLSRDATMNAKPELEIYADDVLCAHGSTIGELDQDALFYLRSRGIPAADARALLISAFLEEVIENCPIEEAQEMLRHLCADWFKRSEGKV